jgi:hypothetical protein
VTDAVLMQLLAGAARTLAAADTPETSIERLLNSIDGELGETATVARVDGTVGITWHDGTHSASRDAFAEGLTALTELAVRSQSRVQADILDAGGFASALDRVAAGARWRGARMAIAVFEVEGMLLGPG